jgi:hypothetical protein
MDEVAKMEVLDVGEDKDLDLFLTCSSLLLIYSI